MTTLTRFGLESHKVETTGSIDLNTVYQVSHKWEMLELADGSILFDSIYADHRVVRQPPELLRNVMRLIERAPCTVNDIVAATGRIIPDVLTVLKPLIDVRILVPDAQGHRPAWATVDFEKRFATQLEWFGVLGANPDEAWEMMRKLQAATVSVIGMGGAGTLLAQALAAAGVGHLVLTDGDTVESSNLVRQIFYTTEDLGHSKVAGMQRMLAAFTPYTTVTARDEFATEHTELRAAVAGADIVALCADAPRFVLNRRLDDVCKELGVAYIGSLSGVVGPFYRPGEPGCFRCFEKVYRDELGPMHDMVVDALAAKQTWRYPSFVAGPLAVVTPMVTEIVLHLTKAAPSTLGQAVVRIKHPESLREPLSIDMACSCARGLASNSQGAP